MTSANELHTRGQITLRLARQEDCKLLWEWANDPEVRASAFDSNPIPWDAHCDWFGEKLRDRNCFIFIAENGKSEPVGQVRFDCLNNEAEIDVSIAGSHRGYGVGSKVILLATEKLFSSSTVRSIHAFVKSTNKRSAVSFEKALFEQVSSCGDEQPASVLHFVRLKTLR